MSDIIWERNGILLGDIWLYTWCYRLATSHLYSLQALWVLSMNFSFGTICRPSGRVDHHYHLEISFGKTQRVFPKIGKLVSILSRFKICDLEYILKYFQTQLKVSIQHLNFSALWEQPVLHKAVSTGDSQISKLTRSSTLSLAIYGTFFTYQGQISYFSAILVVDPLETYISAS